LVTLEHTVVFEKLGPWAGQKLLKEKKKNIICPLKILPPSCKAENTGRQEPEKPPVSVS
jgi:hypothetical protein